MNKTSSLTSAIITLVKMDWFKRLLSVMFGVMVAHPGTGILLTPPRPACFKFPD